VLKHFKHKYWWNRTFQKQYVVHAPLRWPC